MGTVLVLIRAVISMNGIEVRRRCGYRKKERTLSANSNWQAMATTRTSSPLRCLRILQAWNFRRQLRRSLLQLNRLENDVVISTVLI